jgi:hypothetical protein
MREPATLVGLNPERRHQLSTPQFSGEKIERNQEEPEPLIPETIKPTNSFEGKTRGTTKNKPGRTKNNQKLANKQDTPRGLTSAPPPTLYPMQKQPQEAQRTSLEAWKPTRLWRTQQPP